MIRIELLYQPRAILPRALLGFSAAVLAGAALLYGLYHLDRRYPLYRLWNQWLGGGAELVVAALPSPATSPAPEPAQKPLVASPAPEEAEPIVPPAVPQEDQPMAPVEAGEPDTLAMEGQKEPAEPGPEEEAGAISQREVLPAGAAHRPPRWSNACQGAVRLNERLPSGILLKSLSCHAQGEYLLEGLSSSQQAVEEFLAILQNLPSRVSLSVWGEGEARAERLYKYRFAFQGQFADLPPQELETLSADQAEKLFHKVAYWADECGLDGLSVKKPIVLPLSPERVQQRQKLWGTGSYQQIGRFLQKLKQVEQIAALGEVVLVPLHGEGSGWVEARLYAAIDAVVRAP
jgi:hypothetical protein